ncbi:hypothetical protein [Endozoicomonas euniceicola]|uniref:Uncharacterized protein n=1 Tax=Endozoicomonas euniceicola TaxID=1234143 RepID=A0ABY6GRA0_9GAMM|nr:hypothetical protein [Endozoicomonas euniceicola]UYM15278.1 hypothetical protein NX720_20845 [Endozoicomonas euniceicola]
MADTVAADENLDIAMLYHKFTTEEFPALDEAIQSVLLKTPLEHSVQALNKVTTDVYKDWHMNASSVRNITIPDTTRLTLNTLKPSGFEGLLKSQVLPSAPTNWEQPDQQLIVSRFLSMLGIAITQNPELKPLHDRLWVFFDCDDHTCREIANSKAGEFKETDISTFTAVYSDCLATLIHYKEHLTQLCDLLPLKLVY